MLYSEGAYQSHDLDFIVSGVGKRKDVDHAMTSIGFQREGDRYVNPNVPWFVEFPRGPLAIGEDLNIRPVRLKISGGSTLALSATDACRDRLAAFFHWSDRQSLEAAVEIALRRRVDLPAIKRWSAREGASTKFDEFRREVTRRRGLGRRSKATD